MNNAVRGILFFGSSLITFIFWVIQGTQNPNVSIMFGLIGTIFTHAPLFLSARHWSRVGLWLDMGWVSPTKHGLASVSVVYAMAVSTISVVIFALLLVSPNSQSQQWFAYVVSWVTASNWFIYLVVYSICQKEKGA